MKQLAFLALLSLVLFSCGTSGSQEHLHQDAQTTPAAEVEAPTDGIFIHITEGYNDAHRVLMPMKMATLMAPDKDVLLYLDIHAVELLVKGAKDLEMEGFESFQTYVRTLLEMGVGIYACPTCLAVAGYTPEDLMEGIRPANKDRFFDFTEGRILTIDY
ncbi:MAG: DsrE family protein [Bacteroidales bacterium]